MFEKLRKLKPEIKNVNEIGGRPDPRFRVVKTEVPAKIVSNTRNNMDVLRLYTHGPLKFENTGRVCGECVNFYPDKQARYGGRCKAYGFKQVHWETPADDLPKGWVHPIDKIHIKPWIGCPTFTKKDRLSRK